MSVKIRKKNNKYLFLDINQNGVRRWEKLPLRLTGDKQKDKETLRTVDEIRFQKELQLARGEHGLIDHIGSKKTLYSFIEELSKTRDKKDRTVKILKYLREYFGGETIQLKQVTSSWIEAF